MLLKSANDAINERLYPKRIKDTGLVFDSLSKPDTILISDKIPEKFYTKG